MSAPYGAPYGAHPGAQHHGLVPFSAFTGGSFPPPPEPSVIHIRSMQKKYGCAAIVLSLLQNMGLIIVLSLWQTGNEVAAIVVLCGGYFSTYFLVLLGSFLETEAINLNVEVQFHRLQKKFTVLKFIFILQLACIYLQRAIVPDLWVFCISYVLFMIMTVDVIKASWKLYKEDETKKLFLLILVIVICLIVLSQTIYFGLFANAYVTTTLVETKLPMGALFIPIFFGQIANIVMIVMTKNWEVKPEVIGTEV